GAGPQGRSRFDGCRIAAAGRSRDARAGCVIAGPPAWADPQKQGDDDGAHFRCAPFLLESRAVAATRLNGSWLKSPGCRGWAEVPREPARRIARNHGTSPHASAPAARRMQEDVEPRTPTAPESRATAASRLRHRVARMTPGRALADWPDPPSVAPEQRWVGWCRPRDGRVERAHDPGAARGGATGLTRRDHRDGGGRDAAAFRSSRRRSTRA